MHKCRNMNAGLAVGGAGRDGFGEGVRLCGPVAVGQCGQLGAGPGAGDDGGHSVGGNGFPGPFFVAAGVVGVDEEGLDCCPAAGDGRREGAAVAGGSEFEGVVDAPSAVDLVEVAFVDEGEDVDAAGWGFERYWGVVPGDPDVRQGEYVSAAAAQELRAGGHVVQELAGLVGRAEGVERLELVDEAPAGAEAGSWRCYGTAGS